MVALGETARPLWRYMVYLVAAVLTLATLLCAFAPPVPGIALRFQRSHNRVPFPDIVQLAWLPQRYVPSHEQDEKRLVLVGDVHGAMDELGKLLRKVDYNRSRDHLILTGDLVDKGPTAPEVLRFCRKEGASCVRGNHDDRLLTEERSRGDRDRDEFHRKDLEWLSQCPLILRLGKIEGHGDMVVVHGGLEADRSFEKQDPFVVMNLRSYIDGEPSDSDDGTPWTRLWKKTQKKKPKQERTTVVYGHHAAAGLNLQKYTLGLDTACVKGGRLTALIIEHGKRSHVSVRCKAYVD